MLSSRKFCLTALTLALSALLLATAARAVEPDKTLPADAEVVMSVNVRQALDSPIVQKYALDMLKQQITGNDKATAFMKAVGLDPFKDIDSVLVTNTGGTGGKTLAVVRGKFDLTKIDAAAAAHAKANPKELAVTKAGNSTVYEMKEDDKTNYAIFPDGKTLVISSDKTYALDAVKKHFGTGGVPNKDLAAALKKVNGKSTVWMVALATDDLKKSLAGNPATKDVADKISYVTGDVNLTKDIQTDVQIHTTDAAAAKQVADALKQLKGFLPLLAGGNEQIAPVVKIVDQNLKISSAPDAASLSLKVTEDEIKKALGMDK